VCVRVYNYSLVIIECIPINKNLTNNNRPNSGFKNAVDDYDDDDDDDDDAFQRHR